MILRLYATDDGDSPRWDSRYPAGRVVEVALRERYGRNEGDRFLVIRVGDRFTPDEVMQAVAEAARQAIRAPEDRGTAVSGWVDLADVTLRSGRRSSFKIECDDLTDAEVAAMCVLLAKVLPPFGWVSGVPTGGTRLADAMKPFASDDRGPLLIIDDVWTTGGSVDRWRANFGPIETVVAVLFARGPTPPGVTALFTLHEGLWTA